MPISKKTGFAYEIKAIIFIPFMNCWQRQVGYCRLYDDAAPLFNMIMDCEPIPFSYRESAGLSNCGKASMESRPEEKSEYIIQLAKMWIPTNLKELF